MHGREWTSFSSQVGKSCLPRTVPRWRSFSKHSRLSVPKRLATGHGGECCANIPTKSEHSRCTRCWKASIRRPSRALCGRKVEGRLGHEHRDSGTLHHLRLGQWPRDHLSQSGEGPGEPWPSGHL